MFPSSDTKNEKGGTDARVHQHVLLYYIKVLYPDSDDVPGKRVLFKIDGGPGRLHMKILVDLRVRDLYLFPGVQNTAHITIDSFHYVNHV
jgi:hypothetical protein